MKHKKPKKRDYIAKELWENDLYRKKVVPSKKEYKRKEKHKNDYRNDY